MSEKYDLEKVYDDEIAPLMTKIIEICKRNKLPMVASFQYKVDEKEVCDRCTTYLFFEERKPKDFAICQHIIDEGNTSPIIVIKQNE